MSDRRAWMAPNLGQWSRFGRWADTSARPELVDQPPRFARRRSAVASARAEGRAVGCSWFDRLTTSVGTDIARSKLDHTLRVCPDRATELLTPPGPDREASEAQLP